MAVKIEEMASSIGRSPGMIWGSAPTTTFETFPFPDGLTPDIPAADYAEDPRAVAIAEAARRPVELRERRFNLPEWVD